MPGSNGFGPRIKVVFLVACLPIRGGRTLKKEIKVMETWIMQ